MEVDSRNWLEGITVDKARQMIAEVEAGEREPFVLYALDVQEYLSLSQWFVDAQRWIRNTNTILDTYEATIIETNKAVDDFVEDLRRQIEDK